MAHFLFVPGGQRKANDWDAVRTVLERHDHRTDAITLSDPKQADLSQHIAEVCDMIGRLDARAVHLVGHSYASFVITGVASSVAERVERLVYVDALIPSSGKSLLDFFRESGIDPASYGVPDWAPFTEPLFFDWKAVEAIPKSYIHCLQSQFLDLTRDIPAYVEARPAREHWSYYELASDHYCMIRDPDALAHILLHC